MNNEGGYIEGISMNKLKLIILGDSLSGKTALIERFANNLFKDKYDKTDSFE